ncbi:MAG: polysaccharide deacetylase family protein [Pseudomonadales bacterium]
MKDLERKVLGQTKTAYIPGDVKPSLIVVIDTEEEFDWSAEPDRQATQVSAMQHIGRVQDIFDEYSVVPCYVVDYPVVSQSEGYEPLVEIFRDGRCEIGAHLHPWVTPPFREELCVYNTYPGNLPRDIERDKLANLTDSITSVFGVKPNIYKAGRYGLGENSAAILHELGFDIDLSVCPPVDYRADGGPDYSSAEARPLWFGPNQEMLEVPISGAFVGWAGGLSKSLFNIAGSLSFLKARGILSRLAAVDRLMLSPEGFSTAEHLKVTKHLYARGVRTFTWSFHSSSVEPGFTTYTKNEAELKEFLDSFRRFFDYFFGPLSGVATTPTKLKNQLETYK